MTAGPRASVHVMGMWDPLSMVRPGWVSVVPASFCITCKEKEPACILFVFLFLINEPSNHWLAWGQKSHILVHITWLIGSELKRCQPTQPFAAKQLNVQQRLPACKAATEEEEKLEESRYAAWKLQIREAKCAAICTACTTWSYTRERQRNPTVGRASTGSGEGAGDATGTAAAFPFAGQDGFWILRGRWGCVGTSQIRGERMCCSRQCLRSCVRKGQGLSLGKTSCSQHSQYHKTREEKDCNPQF